MVGGISDSIHTQRIFKAKSKHTQLTSVCLKYSEIPVSFPKMFVIELGLKYLCSKQRRFIKRTHEMKLLSLDKTSWKNLFKDQIQWNVRSNVTIDI